MNIYIHVEISSRELDSKLLLAVLAADKGHDVLISDLEIITKGLQRNLLSPGIFHTKSVTPGNQKIKIHQSLIDIGTKITSLDEEAGLVDFGYDKFAKERYSDFTLKQSSAIFGWGPEDTKTLKKIYPQHHFKIHMTGSPRADLWKPFFSKYWDKYNNQNRPYILIPSNTTGIINMTTFYNLIKNYKNSGYLKRDPNLLKSLFDTTKEDVDIIYSFLKTIRLLSNNNAGYDIILRPHPTENIEAWEILLDGLPNVKVIREDSISKWVNNAFAIIHNSCTTALEAYISNKPVITYIPFEREHFGKLPNQIGQKLKTSEQVLMAVNDLYYNNKSIDNTLNSSLASKIIDDKIFLDKELSASKIINIWETLDNQKLSKKNNWYKFKLSLKLMQFNGFLKKFLKNPSGNNFRNSSTNYKFPPLEEGYIKDRVLNLVKILDIKSELDCKLLSKKSILITKNEF